MTNMSNNHIMYDDIWLKLIYCRSVHVNFELNRYVAVNTKFTKWNTCWKKTNQSNFSFQMPSKFKTYFSLYLTSAKSSLHVNIDSWKIYLTTKEGRDKLLLQSIDKDGQHIRVYDYRLETPDDKSLKITICCVPLSVDVSAVFETLSKLKFLQK